MFFRIISKIGSIEAIATGRSIREIRRLRKSYGGRRWRKMKGIGKIELPDGTICLAELHWYECHGVGSKEFKLKRILEKYET
jgi:hypothetical protein